MGGHMLIALAKHYPKMRGVVFDLPPVASRAQDNIFEAKLPHRLEAVRGSFFDEFPSELKQCDVFYLKFVLHDWSDEQCIAILKRIKEASSDSVRTGSKPVPIRIVTTDFI